VRSGYAGESILIQLIGLKYEEVRRDERQSEVIYGCGLLQNAVTNNSLNNPSVPVSVHCTDFLILHMLLASVHSGDVNLCRSVSHLKSVRLWQ